MAMGNIEKGTFIYTGIYKLMEGMFNDAKVNLDKSLKKLAI